MAGRGEQGDLDYLAELAETIKGTSRCGLGQTSPNSVLDLLRHFRHVLDWRVAAVGDGLRASFDMDAALQDAERATGRTSTHREEDHP